MQKILITTFSILFSISLISCKSTSSGVKSFDTSSVPHISISEFLPKGCATTNTTRIIHGNIQSTLLKEGCIDPTDFGIVESNPQIPNIKVIDRSRVGYFGNFVKGGTETYLKYLNYANWCNRHIPQDTKKDNLPTYAHSFCDDYILELNENGKLDEDTKDFFFGDTNNGRWHVLAPITHIVGENVYNYGCSPKDINSDLPELANTYDNGVTQELIFNFLYKENGEFRTVTERYIFTYHQQNY